MTTKRTPKYRPSHPRITPAAVNAYRRGDGRALHEILHLAPWEISPLRVADIPEPDLRTCHDKIWFSSWWKANALREELEAVVIARR
jgi:hypothetical protein